jgi:hypothetical protein
LQVTVWENDRVTGVGNRKEQRTYRTVALKRSYLANDQWQETKVTLPLSDVLQAARMLENANDAAYEHLGRLKDEARRQEAEDQVEVFDEEQDAPAV